MTDEDRTYERSDLLKHTTAIVIAAIHARPNDPIVTVIRDTYAALSATGDAAPEKPEHEPAVPIAQSVKPDFIVCLEDGKKLKMLKRYLRTRYDMTPDEYRQKWGLPSDYPMVCGSYAKRRREIAIKAGLGTKK